MPTIKKKPKMFRYRLVCEQVGFGNNHSGGTHSGFDFVWDTITDIADPKAAATANVKSELVRGWHRPTQCTCGGYLIFTAEEVVEAEAPSAPALSDLDELKAMYAARVDEWRLSQKSKPSDYSASTNRCDLYETAEVTSKIEVVSKMLDAKQKEEKMSHTIHAATGTTVILGPISTEPGIFSKAKDTIKNDAAEAAWIITASQSVKVARTFLLSTLGRTLPKKYKAWLATLSALLSTPYGEAGLGYCLALALMAAPSGKNTPKRQILASKLRINAMALAGGGVADIIREYVLNDMILGQLDAMLDSVPDEPAALEGFNTDAIRENIHTPVPAAV